MRLRLWLSALAILTAILAWHGDAAAACTTETIILPDKIIFCTTCCYADGNCTTTCM